MQPLGDRRTGKLLDRSSDQLRCRPCEMLASRGERNRYSDAPTSGSFACRSKNGCRCSSRFRRCSRDMGQSFASNWFWIAKMCWVVSSHRVFSSRESSVASFRSLVTWSLRQSAESCGCLQLSPFSLEVRHRHAKDSQQFSGFISHGTP